MKKNANKGFSLVELIIVIAIMAVLIGVLAPQFIKQVEKSRESTDLQNIDEIKTAAVAYVADKEDVAADITIAVTADGTNTATYAVKVGTDDADFDGLAASGNLKSKKWNKSFTWTYKLTDTTPANNYKWSMTAGSDAEATYYKADGTQK